MANVHSLGNTLERMDGDKNRKDGQAKNKQCPYQKCNASQTTTNQPTNQTPSPQSPESYAEGSQPSSPSPDFGQHVLPCSDMSPQPGPTLRDHRHSLSGLGTANGAMSATSPVNAVVKASSTGTLSSAPPPFHAHNSKRENKLPTTVGDCVSNFPFSCSGPLVNNFVRSGSCSANAGKTANGGFDADLFASGHIFFPQSSPLLAASTPQNQAVYNWQATKTSVKERLTYLYNTDTMTDIQFKVGKPPAHQIISAHKFILSIGSAVFDALFNGRLATSDSIIEIPDVEPAAFSALLRFLYTDDVQIGPETVMTTLYTAKKYAVPALERACVEFLKRNLSSDNAFMLLTQARLFDEPQLAALCLETIDKNTSEALAADGFTDIDLDTLCVVLERDTLGIRECKLFSAVCRWAEAECLRQNLIPPTSENQRRVLSKALRLIRFPLMTVEEFAMGSAQSGILEDREVVELFLYFTVNPKPSISFLDVPRCCLTGKEQVVSRFCQIESRWGYSGTSDRIRFMVNRRIYVVGFGLYGSIHGPTEYSVNIQIIHMDSTKVMGSNDPTFQCDGTTSTFRVMFKEPVEILPNTSYIACATLKGPDSYYGSKGLRKVTHESVSSGKVTFQFTYAAGNNNGTSVEDGQIPEIIFYT
ncbi:BTB/POZ domain-containing protein 1-like isoform X2 [Biomphalaria glabrata]|uniref:BTB/POZ domain-containing protein 1-like isoform X2 n=1 Tax=Biomphalaria glabrata TaxID=6526 RepID=A0A9W2YVE1_BIOGL|nr:BTB/POZ domain-containing protein 1-like isoform X2 [Biomphalaria glabrata]